MKKQQEKVLHWMLLLLKCEPYEIVPRMLAYGTYQTRFVGG